MRALLILLVLLSLSCGSENGEPQSPNLAPQGAAVECERAGSACIRYGRLGTCRANRCVLQSGACSYDVDCEDGNACSQTSCVEGVCAVELMQDGLCQYDDDTDGVCVDGRCLAQAPPSCAEAEDCPDTERACQSWGCERGACVSTALPDGDACEAPSGRDGTCAGGRCRVELSDEAEDERVCEEVVGRWGRVRRRCRGGTRFRLPETELQAAAARFADRIAEQVSYEVSVSLVPLADGGYNVVVTNIRDRDSVQGLVDPSLIAWEVAHLTRATDWSSRNLIVWVTPYTEGWMIPTRGGREAVSRGRRRAGFLGALGVVNLPEFRRWLALHFTRATPPAPLPATVSTGAEPSPPGETG